MKKKSRNIFKMPFFALGAVLLLLSGCDLLLGKPEEGSVFSPEGTGILSVSFSGAEAAETSAARTMLASSPEFTRYELTVSPNPETGSGSKIYPSDTASFQLTLPNGTYNLSGAGFTGNKPTARTWDLAKREIVTTQITVSGGSQITESLALAPYMEDGVSGILHYSLNWDTVGQIPARAELLIEQYDPADDAWNPIPISLIGENAVAGAQRGTVLLLQRTTGLVQQAGSLDLPPGEYRLTATVAMDGPYPPVSRTDIAHIFSNLTTPAAFFYGSGDLTITGSGMDTGSGFITAFNFSQTPGAPSIIGSSPGPDGTRLIMVTVPPGTNLTHLTPVAECAPGATIISPAPSLGPDNMPYWPAGDYSKPTTWIAQGKNGVTQQYTVWVTEAAEGDCLITNIAFREVGLTSAPLIDQSSGSITVVVPYGTKTVNPNYDLTPVFSYIGKEVKFVAGSDASQDTPLAKIAFMNNGTPARNFRVYAQNGATKQYTVMILEAASGEAEITGFVFDGYPDRHGTVTPPSNSSNDNGTITVTLPFGMPLASLTPLIQYKGKLSPSSGVEQNFSVPGNVKYTVTSEDNSVTKTYAVTVNTESANLGLFDFVITNVPRAKVVIGTKPRADGKIPIVVQVPYRTTPLTDPADGPDLKTDLKQLKYAITLSDTANSKWAWAGKSDPQPTEIPFGNQDDYQEAVFTITPKTGTAPLPTQDYVVVVARDVHYYYVKASGKDDDADQYNGSSESIPFKTLAYAVYQAVKHNVDHIYVIGTLNDTSEGGAWEDTSTTTMGDNGTFQQSGAPAVAGGNSVFNLNGAGRDGNSAWPIYITGIGSNAVLQGTAGKRVISVTGRAHITFDNITIQGGGGASSYSGNGGGMYVGGNSTVIWKSGSITGNRALSGGGVYVDNSEFDMISGSVSGNTAAGAAVVRSHFENNTITDASIAGGGGVYVYGEDSLLWLNNGEISNNSTSGSGGGVLVNASAVPDSPTPDTMPHNFIMSAGAVNNNRSTGGVWPHGGGGVFVAKGSFEMLSGHIMGNAASRQGGGVFVWSRALFYMDGDSSITNNTGTGSAKAICSRGITTMRGNAQADSVYIWNYAKGSWNNDSGDEFTLMEGARTTGLVLAFADDPQDNRNYINIVESDRVSGKFFTGTDRITTIDLESRLNNDSKFSTTATIDGDWLSKYLIKDGGNIIPAAQAADLIKRFPLGSFTSGNPSKPLSGYKLDNTGKLAK